MASPRYLSGACDVPVQSNTEPLITPPLRSAASLARLVVLAALATPFSCAGPRETAAGDAVTITLWTQDTWLGITGHELDGVPLDDPRRALYTHRDWYVKVTDDFKALHPDRRIDFEIEVFLLFKPFFVRGVTNGALRG